MLKGVFFVLLLVQYAQLLPVFTHPSGDAHDNHDSVVAHGGESVPSEESADGHGDGTVETDEDEGLNPEISLEEEEVEDDNSVQHEVAKRSTATEHHNPHKTLPKHVNGKKEGSARRRREISIESSREDPYMFETEEEHHKRSVVEHEHDHQMRRKRLADEGEQTGNGEEHHDHHAVKRNTDQGHIEESHPVAKRSAEHEEHHAEKRNVEGHHDHVMAKRSVETTELPHDLISAPPAHEDKHFINKRSAAALHLTTLPTPQVAQHAAKRNVEHEHSNSEHHAEKRNTEEHEHTAKKRHSDHDHHGAKRNAEHEHTAVKRNSNHIESVEHHVEKRESEHEEPNHIVLKRNTEEQPINHADCPEEHHVAKREAETVEVATPSHTFPSEQQHQVDSPFA